MKQEQTKLEIPLQTKSLTLRLNEELYNKLLLFKSIYSKLNEENITLSSLIRMCIEYTLDSTPASPEEHNHILLASAFVTQHLSSNEEDK